MDEFSILRDQSPAAAHGFKNFEKDLPVSGPAEFPFTSGGLLVSRSFPPALTACPACLSAHSVLAISRVPFVIPAKDIVYGGRAHLLDHQTGRDRAELNRRDQCVD